MIAGDFLAQLFPLLLLTAVAFLGLLAWLVWIVYRRQQAKKSDAPSDPYQLAGDDASGWPDEPPGNQSNLPPPPPVTAAAPPGADTVLASGDAVEVFRVLRDLADGALIVEIGGRQYRRLVDITDAQVGRRFVANARALGHFAMLLKGPPPPAPPPEAPAAARMEDPPLPMPPLSPPAPSRPVQSTPMRPLQASRRQGGAQAGDEPPAEMINVAEQIESFMQFKLATHPQLAGRSIHVRPSFKGGVRIVVDDTSFDSVDEVPDPDVRAFIQSTIQEWNARN